MSTTALTAARTRTKARLSFGRFRTWLVACAVRPEARLWLVIQLAILHAVLWTFIHNLASGRTAQATSQARKRLKLRRDFVRALAVGIEVVDMAVA